MESINPNDDQKAMSATYIIEYLSDGRVCIRLSSDPQMFAIGQDENDAMEVITNKLLGLNESHVDSLLKPQVDEIEKLYVDAGWFDKIGFVFRAYNHGYQSVEQPFIKYKDFLIYHAFARVYFSSPIILVFAFISIFFLVAGVFFSMVEFVSSIITSFLPL